MLSRYVCGSVRSCSGHEGSSWYGRTISAGGRSPHWGTGPCSDKLSEDGSAESAEGSGSGSPSCAYVNQTVASPGLLWGAVVYSIVLLTIRRLRVLTEMPSAAAASALESSLFIGAFRKKITSRTSRNQSCRVSPAVRGGLCRGPCWKT